MPPSRPNIDAFAESPLTAALRHEFRQGFHAAHDPQNAGLPELDLRITTVNSRWYTLLCPVCKQKFREEDQVRLCPQCGRAYHDDDQYQLHCWQAHFADGRPCTVEHVNPFDGRLIEGCTYQWSGILPPSAHHLTETNAPAIRMPQLTATFRAGLDRVWTPYGDAAVDEVGVGDRRVGRECPWCRFQIRTGDRVVKCPCGRCNTYFHDDLFRHLTCWNAWNGSRGNHYCPTTGHLIERPRHSSPAPMVTTAPQDDTDESRR